MEKLAELKSKFLKFLPRQPVASIHKSSLSPSGSVAGNRSPCRHIVSIIPKEARRKLRNSSFSAREPSSPKVSCMGEVDQLMKRKKKRKTCKHQSGDEKSDKKEKMLPWIFKGSRGDHHQRNSGKALDLELVEKEKAQHYSQSVPSLGTMKKFASGRGTLADFDAKLAQLSTGWPICDCLIAFYSSGYPLEKVEAYVALRKNRILYKVAYLSLLWSEIQGPPHNLHVSRVSSALEDLWLHKKDDVI